MKKRNTNTNFHVIKCYYEILTQNIPLWGAGGTISLGLAKQLLNHLESYLANEHTVEVKPQGISTGLVAKKILSRMVVLKQSL
ncbi:hypothetical protein AAZX31_01G030800 [Glycine max]